MVSYRFFGEKYELFGISLDFGFFRDMQKNDYILESVFLRFTKIIGGNTSRKTA